MNVQKAGCILLDLMNKKVGLVYRKKQNDYSFSKGHLDFGESLEECAIRETEEETGRKCRIINSKTLPPLSYIDSRGDKTETYYFLAIDEGESSQTFNPELVHEIVWKSIEEVENILSYDNLVQFWKEIKYIVDELFKNKILKLFLPKDDSYLGSAIKIKNESLMETQIIYTEDFVKNNSFDSIANNDILYFFGNDLLAHYVVGKLQNKSCYIFNNFFFVQNYKKLEIQNILNENQISTPQQISYSDLQENKHFPLFCKENKHAGIVCQIYKKSALNDFLNKFDKNDFYLEQPISDKDSIPKEFKVYYVNGNVYSQDEVLDLINDKIKEVCIKIANCLNNLETFSVDIIQTSKGYYVVDVNPASGFFLSSGARKAFLNSIFKK